MALLYKMLDEGAGIQVDEDGRPIVIDEEEDNKEFGLDAIHLYTKIPALQAEAKKYREGFANLEPEDVRSKLGAYEDVANKLKSFGDMNAEDAKEALSTVANLDQLDKERNIEIEKVKAGVADAYKSKINDIDVAHGIKVQALEEAISVKDLLIRKQLIKGAFDRSEFIKGQTVLPAEMAYDTFGKHFHIEEDKGELQVFALDYKGEKIYSLAKPGDPAPPEEAIEMLINSYPHKDNILRTSAGGSGAGGNISGDATKRAKLEALKVMSPTARLNALRR